MNFTKIGFDSFRADVKEALRAVEQKHGVTVECGAITYGTYDFSMKMKVVKSGSVDGNRKLFELHCGLYGFAKEDYEREFALNGTKFQLVGFNPKSPKNCCSIRRVSDGKMYKCTSASVKNNWVVK